MAQLRLADISPHLTESILEDALKSKTGNLEAVRSVKISRAAPAGEGLISAVYRIRVEGTQSKANFVVKGLVNDTLLRTTLKCEDLFKREALFFQRVLPILVNNQILLGAKERIQDYVPICYACHCDGKDDYIILEDLTEKDFRTKKTELSSEQCDLALRTLAHFHSVSFALRETHPEDFQKLTEGLDEVYYLENNHKWYTKYLNRALKIDRDALALHENENSLYYRKFLEIASEDVYEKLVQLSSTRGENSVILHGDAWLQNFLFTYKRAVVIDFQLLRCSSPMMDLVFLILLCENLCRSKSDFDRAVRVYYDALTYYLADMGLDVQKLFPWNILWNELREYGRFGFYQVLTTIPLTLAADPCDTLANFASKYDGIDRIPLEDLWQLRPLGTKEQQMRFVNTLRVAVDVGII